MTKATLAVLNYLDRKSKAAGNGSIWLWMGAAVVTPVLLLAYAVQILLTPLTEAPERFLDFITGNKDRLVMVREVGTYAGIFPYPSGSDTVTSPFGPRIHPITGKESSHSGTDFSATYGDILAVADGRVMQVGYDHWLGRYVLLRHDLGGETLYTLYGHLRYTNVFRKQEVVQGTIIGREGGDPADPLSGVSTGQHLHFEIRTREKGGQVDPLPYLLPPPPPEGGVPVEEGAGRLPSEDAEAGAPKEGGEGPRTE